MEENVWEKILNLPQFWWQHWFTKLKTWQRCLCSRADSFRTRIPCAWICLLNVHAQERKRHEKQFAVIQIAHSSLHPTNFGIQSRHGLGKFSTADSSFGIKYSAAADAELLQNEIRGAHRQTDRQRSEVCLFTIAAGKNTMILTKDAGYGLPAGKWSAVTVSPPKLHWELVYHMSLFRCLCCTQASLFVHQCNPALPYSSLYSTAVWITNKLRKQEHSDTVSKLPSSEYILCSKSWIYELSSHSCWTKTLCMFFNSSCQQIWV